MHTVAMIILFMIGLTAVPRITLTVCSYILHPALGFAFGGLLFLTYVLGDH